MSESELSSPLEACIKWLSRQPPVIELDIAALVAMMLPARKHESSVYESDLVGFLKEWLSEPLSKILQVSRALHFRTIVDFSLVNHFSREGHEAALHTMLTAVQDERFAGLREHVMQTQQNLRFRVAVWERAKEEWDQLKTNQLSDAYLYRYRDLWFKK
jgi:hypothetical protein